MFVVIRLLEAFSNVGHKVVQQLTITVIPRLHDTTGCQTGCTTGMTTGCIVQTNIQPVVNAVVNRFDNRLYRVNGTLQTTITVSQPADIQ